MLSRTAAKKTIVVSLLLFSCNYSTLAENRLAKETSPYLRLHAHNPVDWYPWGPEALKKAKKENKVIFLSVGYSSCHWCHVMERESFMDEEIAKFLNDNFVCIKVDREERPDVDAIYMMAVQIITRRGGWPMSVFMTPDAKPFHGGTYFPARTGDRPGQIGFLPLITQVIALWNAKESNVKLHETADQVTELIKVNLNRKSDEAEAAPAGPVSKEVADRIVAAVQRDLVREFDPQYGGFGFDPGQPARPKFPEPSNLLFLLERARQGDGKAQQMVEVSLQKMHGGGIWDHIGGGFHRYSVDRFWHIPHFEKMLYDNGQLATVYSQGYEITKNPAYQRVVERIAEWTLREMRHESGAFYSALDAESENIEGKFYRWELKQLKNVLGNGFELYAAAYGLDEAPNFEHFYVPQRTKTLNELAQEQNATEAKLWQELAPLHQNLLKARELRPRPLTDTKILASWNGLMIRGLADAGRVFKRDDYVKAAAAAASFVLNRMRQPNGRLYRTHTAGESKLNAYLDDYAFVVDGLIALHKATGNDAWLKHATDLTDVQIQFFLDEQQGGFFFTSKDHEALIARGKQPSDGAQPSGNSVAAQNLIYLAKVANRPDLRRVAEQTIGSMLSTMEKSPRMAPRMAVALTAFTE